MDSKANEANLQIGEIRKCIQCLFCKDSKPLNGFLSHIRQEHLNYKRYKCTKCTYECDTEEESTLHLLETSHNLKVRFCKFDDTSYQEYLARKIFQDCCREGCSDRSSADKREDKNSEEDCIFEHGEAMQPTTVCRKCGKKVVIHYVARKKHALQFHFTQNDDPELFKLLPATVKACFPEFSPSSDYECSACGKIFETDRGRRNHVLKEHFYWSAACPLLGCTTIINANNVLLEHFKLDHRLDKPALSKNLKLMLRNMKKERGDEFFRQLNECFPCPLPGKKPNSTQHSEQYKSQFLKPSLSDVLSSLISSHSNKQITRKNPQYSSSDSESSCAEIEDIDKTVIKTIHDCRFCLSLKDSQCVFSERGTVTLIVGSFVDVTELTNHPKDMENFDISFQTSHIYDGSDSFSDGQQLSCTICHLKVAKNVMESHAWTHLSIDTQANNRLPFQCTGCDFTAYRIFDIIYHAKIKHMWINENLFVPGVPWEVLKAFLRKVVECFPPVKHYM
ncbi:unnamed protein product [Thelazia callipaeda]|uniref:C2H2-type domain-containing protein n=1 Tax=Thelazia callipaeda TaxID=103827 RepID=A0A0N5CLS2_THECL|nr:unnamed protein product [Thelazia callipaeda]